MTKYLLAFHGGGDAPDSEEESTRLIAAWSEWMAGLGESLVDPGSYATASATISRRGTIEGGGVNPVTGYTVIEAPSLEAAVDVTGGCPIFDADGDIEVVELGDT